MSKQIVDAGMGAEELHAIDIRFLYKQSIKPYLCERSVELKKNGVSCGV